MQSKNAEMEIWADSVSLQPFTKEQWRSHQDKSINKVIYDTHAHHIFCVNDGLALR